MQDLKAIEMNILARIALRARTQEPHNYPTIVELLAQRAELSFAATEEQLVELACMPA